MGTKYSTNVTNARATPVVKNNSTVSGNEVEHEYDTFELAAGDLDADDLVVIARLPSNAVVRDIRVLNDDLDSNATPTLVFRCGVYTTAGTAKDDDVYAAAGQTTLQSQNTTWTSIFKKDPANLNKQLWEDAGDTTDPGGHYDIVLKFNTGAATAAAGTLAVDVAYSLN